MAEMFTEIVRPAARAGAKRWYTVPISIVVHAALLAVLIAVPLLATGTVPLPSAVIVFASPASPTPPEMPRAAPPPKAADVAANVPAPGPPTEAPSTIQPETPSYTLVGPGSIGLPPGVTGASIGIPAMPDLPVITPAVATGPLRPGGQIKVPVKVYDVAPAYPPFAVRAKLSGNVIIEATIDTEGRVTDARVVQSVPLLDQAALDAVRRWRYRPTLLNGVPVSIVMRVTVAFALK